MKDEFLLQCKENYFEGVTPSNSSMKEREGYKKIVSLAKGYFNSNKYEEFADYFMEGQYFIPLWVAHMLLEYGDHNRRNLMSRSIKIIEQYSDNPLAPKVAEEERKWLDENIEKFKSP